MHLCSRPMNMSRLACCQLVLMLNDTLRIPQCDPSWLLLDHDDGRNRSKPSWVLIEETEHSGTGDEPLVFCLGVALLLLVALAATLTLNRITKPKAGELEPSYNIMMWMPSSGGSRRSSRRSSLLVMLRSVSSCRSRTSFRPSTNRSTPANSSNRHSNALSIVSNMSLPSYQLATSSTRVSHTSLQGVMSASAPPPYYEHSSSSYELQPLSTSINQFRSGRERPLSLVDDSRLEQRLLNEHS